MRIRCAVLGTMLVACGTHRVSFPASRPPEAPSQEAAALAAEHALLFAHPMKEEPPAPLRKWVTCAAPYVLHGRDLTCAAPEGELTCADRPDEPVDRRALMATMAAMDTATCSAFASSPGDAHVTVTFSNDGHVVSAVSDQPPFDMSTAAGRCIASAFAEAHIPRFGGSLLKIGRSVALRR